MNLAVMKLLGVFHVRFDASVVFEFGLQINVLKNKYISTAIITSILEKNSQCCSCHASWPTAFEFDTCKEPRESSWKSEKDVM